MKHKLLFAEQVDFKENCLFLIGEITKFKQKLLTEKHYSLAAFICSEKVFDTVDLNLFITKLIIFDLCGQVENSLKSHNFYREFFKNFTGCKILCSKPH